MMINTPLNLYGVFISYYMNASTAVMNTFLTTIFM